MNLKKAVGNHEFKKKLWKTMNFKKAVANHEFKKAVGNHLFEKSCRDP